jgi:hypothetical protein
VLHEDGERVECHACGRFFAALGRHALLAHNLLPEEYRAIFGLNAGQGLVGPSYRAVLQKGAERLRPYWPDVAANLIERRGSWQGRRMRLQARRNSENLKRWHAAASKGGARVHELRVEGKWKPTGAFRDPSVAAEMSARAHQRLRELRADPVWSATYRETLRRANGGAPMDVTCKVCGRAIQTSRRDFRRGVGQLCGDACRAESRRRANLLRWRGDPAYIQVVEELGALQPAAFAKLDRRDVSLLSRYYGVGGEAPVLLNELARDSGLSAARVGEIIRVAVASLLGPGVVTGSTDPCVICGTAVVRRGPRPRATCGKACHAERRRQLALERHARGGWKRRQPASA